MSELYLALVHYPVFDRRGKVVAAAVTSLDIHDLARAARTFGIRGVFIVHPVTEQREFALRVRDHWLEGHGRQFDSRREEALRLVQVVVDLDAVIAAVERESGARPALIYTSARAENGISYEAMRERLAAAGAPAAILLFGTGFGLTPEVAARAEFVLAPILGSGDYNHLSVRSAVSIILDRLRGR